MDGRSIVEEADKAEADKAEAECESESDLTFPLDASGLQWNIIIQQQQQPPVGAARR